MKLGQIKIDKIKIFFQKTSYWLARHTFLASMILIVLAVIIGGIVFYKYSYLLLEAELQTVGKPLKFDEKKYQKILEIWQERQKISEESATKEYPDPYR